MSKIVISLALLFLIPYPLKAQSWVQKSKGIDGGNITALATKGNRIFAATQDAKIFKSDDDGLNWSLSSKGITGTNITSIISNGDKLYAGSYSDGVYYSTDDGDSWKLISNGLGNLQVTCLHISNGTLLAGTVMGVYKLNNDQVTWSGINSGLPSDDPYLFPWINSLLTKDNIIIAGSFRKGAYISSNNGLSWTSIIDIPADVYVYCSIIKDNFIYLSTSEGIFISSDDGTHWLKTGTGISTGNYVNSLLVKGNIIYAATSAGLYSSSNNGSTWSSILFNENYFEDRATKLLIKDNNLYVGTGLTIYHSSDNAITWEKRCKGIVALPITNITVMKNLLFSITENGLYRSSDYGESWIDVNRNDQKIHSIIVKGDTLLGQSIFRTLISIDGGASWNFFSNTGTNYSPKLISAYKGSIFASNADGFFVFPKGGNTWLKLDTNPNSTDFNYMVSSGGKLLVTSFDSNIYVSSDNGNSWHTSTNGLPSYFIPTSMVALKDKVFLTTNDGEIFTSINQGTSWVKINNEILFTSAFHNANNYLIRGAEGIIFSPDEGYTWIDMNTNSTSTLIIKSFANLGETLYAGTSEGIWSQSLSDFRPQIESFTPTSGVPGSVITLSGHNFSSQSDFNSVTINGIIAQSKAISSTNLLITVPQGATSGRISIKVNDQTAISSTSFCLGVQKPTLSVLVQANDEIILSSSSTIGNQWLLNDMPIDGAVEQTYYPTIEGIYSVLINSTGCSSEPSDEYNYIITGIEFNQMLDVLQVYPIPSTDKLSISLKNFTANTQVQLRLYDIYGRKMKEWKEYGGIVITTSISSFTHGTYFLTVTEGSKIYKARIIKE